MIIRYAEEKNFLEYRGSSSYMSLYSNQEHNNSYILNIVQTISSLSH